MSKKLKKRSINNTKLHKDESKMKKNIVLSPFSLASNSKAHLSLSLSLSTSPFPPPMFQFFYFMTSNISGTNLFSYIYGQIYTNETTAIVTGSK